MGLKFHGGTICCNTHQNVKVETWGHRVTKLNEFHMGLKFHGVLKCCNTHHNDEILTWSQRVTKLNEFHRGVKISRGTNMLKHLQ